MKFVVNLNLIQDQREAMHFSLTEMAEALGLSSVDQYLRRESGT